MGRATAAARPSIRPGLGLLPSLTPQPCLSLPSVDMEWELGPGKSPGSTLVQSALMRGWGRSPGWTGQIS